MSDIARVFRDFISLTSAHPEGPDVARAFNRTLQFDLEDDAPFYMQAVDGRIEVHEGDSGLAWKGKDWERVTCVHTTTGVLRDIIAGRILPSEAFFSQQIGFAPRRMADRHTSAEAVVSWFYNLIRLAHEQAQTTAHARFVAELGA